MPGGGVDGLKNVSRIKGQAFLLLQSQDEPPTCQVKTQLNICREAQAVNVHFDLEERWVVDLAWLGWFRKKQKQIEGREASITALDADPIT